MSSKPAVCSMTMATVTGCVLSQRFVKATSGASSRTGVSRSRRPSSTARSTARAVKLFADGPDPEQMVRRRVDAAGDVRLADAAGPDRAVPVHQGDRGAGDPVLVEDLLNLRLEFFDFYGARTRGFPMRPGPAPGPRPQAAARTQTPTGWHAVLSRGPPPETSERLVRQSSPDGSAWRPTNPPGLRADLRRGLLAQHSTPCPFLPWQRGPCPGDNPESVAELYRCGRADGLRLAPNQPCRTPRRSTA